MIPNGKAARVCIFLSLMAMACGDRTERPEADGEMRVVDRGKFGDPYQVVPNFNPADPDLYPLLSSDTLVVRLTYPGGCETHRLDVRHETRDDSAFVWIHHDARGDNCEAMVQDEVETRVPRRVAEAPIVALLHPQGGQPQILRRQIDRDETRRQVE